MDEILLTGFEPFGADPFNPSGACARALDGAVIAGRRVRGLLLPVRFGEAAERALRAAAGHRPARLVSLGVNARRPERGLALEARAHNARRGEGVEGPVLPGAPESWDCPLDLASLAQTLCERDVPASVSHDAGIYVCNDTLARLLEAHRAGALAVVPMFVHLSRVREMNGPHDRSAPPLSRVLDDVCALLSCLG